MFGGGVVEENVGSIACAGGDDGVLAGERSGRKIGASGCGGFGVFGEGAAQVVQPLGLGASVVVDVDDEFAMALFGGVVAGGGKAGGSLGEQATGEFGGRNEARYDFFGGVGGAVVDDEEFEI